MSQTVARPAPGGHADPGGAGGPGNTALAALPPVPPQPTVGERVRRRVRSVFDGTPGRLRTAAIVGVLVSLVFAALGGYAFMMRGAALDDARDSAAQLVRVQRIAIDLTQADAVVTNAFLQGGQEPPGVVAQYQGYLDSASSQLAQAARAEPGDADALAVVNAALGRYSAAVAQARANNRQGFQTGSGYLRQASDLLRTTTATQPGMLPTLQAVADADAARVGDAFDAARNAAYTLLVAGLVVFGGLLGVQIWLARRTRRILNVPLTWGTGAVLVSLLLGAVVLVTGQRAANDVRNTSYSAALALTRARIAAFDARANESLTLVYQGSGQTYETAYGKRLAAARTAVAEAEMAGVKDAGGPALTAWDTVHRQLRTLDDGGKWPEAVALSTGKAKAAFADFDTTSAGALDQQAAAVRSGLEDRHWLLVVLGWLTLIVGLLAAGAAAAGVGQRLGEYR